MKISMSKITWTSTGVVFALLCGAPVVADDTELLLLNPDPSQNPKPNVLFILDTSGSMGTEEDTTEPYDSALIYTGDCDPTRMYWTDIDVQPVCNVGNLNYIEGSAFVCDFAGNQIAGIGSYTDTMIQYRDGGIAGGDTSLVDVNTWQTVASGYNTQPVECQADRGKHGDDSSGSDVYATAGTNVSSIFTSDQGQEVGWGSSPRHISYTMYSGNYLNWKNSPVNTRLTRSVIMKEVTKKVLSSVNNLNVGLMRFNNMDGGPVILGMTDLDANRQDVLDAINSLPANGRTPLSETLYESALYWRGMPAYFGENINETPTNPNALVSTNPEVYKQPDWEVCAKNYTVLLTDGEPVDDQEAETLAPTLPNFATALGRSACTFTTMGDCLDDIAEYLATEDVDPNTDGDQLVTTHTIGFSINLPILEETATASGGQYFLANDVESLTRTLLSIIANINDRSLSFSAPAVSVNTFNRTQNLNDLYITMFGAKNQAHWPGNLKKYRLANSVIVDANDNPAVDATTGFFADTAKSIWTTGGADGNDVRLGGAAQQLPDPSTRNLYTNNSGSDLTADLNQVSVGNETAFLNSDFGLTGSTGEPTKAELIRWARGEDLLNEDNNTATTVRKAMGDPLHSQPAAVVYGGTQASPEVVVFTATNDGYLHAIDGATGNELWAYIPFELMRNLTRLYFDPRSRYKQYGIDGNVVPVTKDVDGDGIIESNDGDFVRLIFGMRRGGNSYYALDVTNRNSPQLLWQRTLTDAGDSWSTPVITRVDLGATVTQNADKAVAVIGGGYDTVHDTAGHPATADGAGAGIHMLDLETGATLWRAGPDTNADLELSTMTRAIPTDIRVIDLNADLLADRMYASDMGGQIWRFDITNGQAAATLVTGGVIAQLGAEGVTNPTAAETRRFYNSPDISLITDQLQQRRFIAISIGSGYRAHPFDLTASDRFYSIRDGDVFNPLTQSQYDNYPIITESDLVEVSGATQTIITANDGGWMFTLPANQKVLSDSLTFNDEIFFVGFSPDSAAAEKCTAGGGTNFLYRVQVVNGDPVVPNIETLSPSLSDDARRQTLQQGGIAPSPNILFPSPEADCVGEDCSPPPLGCVGVECFDPGFPNFPVRTLWTQDGVE
jgi:type IV pilus assembly protein PilY1